MPPSAVERPSARNPAVRLSSRIGFSTISPTATALPVVSTMVTSMTRIMERMAANPKLGSPKWNGVVTPKNAASPTPSKSVYTQDGGDDGTDYQAEEHRDTAYEAAEETVDEQDQGQDREGE